MLPTEARRRAGRELVVLLLEYIISTHDEQ